MAADAAAWAGVTLAELSEATREKLDAVLAANWSHGNPVDIIGDAPWRATSRRSRSSLTTPPPGAVVHPRAYGNSAQCRDRAR
ncbi:MAG: hypothetical protein IPO43_18645 [Rhodoferax sp.]|nr:hypothetical protein [Rhodoferax sp.]